MMSVCVCVCAVRWTLRGIHYRNFVFHVTSEIQLNVYNYTSGDTVVVLHSVSSSLFCSILFAKVCLRE